MHTIFDAITTRLHLTEKNSQIDNKFPLQPISNLFTFRSQLKLAKMEWSGKWYKGVAPAILTKNPYTSRRVQEVLQVVSDVRTRTRILRCLLHRKHGRSVTSETGERVRDAKEVLIADVLMFLIWLLMFCDGCWTTLQFIQPKLESSSSHGGWDFVRWKCIWALNVYSSHTCWCYKNLSLYICSSLSKNCARKYKKQNI